MKPALTHGHGPKKAIFMNGWLNCANDWATAFSAIDPAACELAVFDYRGYGTRRDVAGEFNFDEATHDVIAMADSLGWQRFAMVGHSMGGMAIQHVALAARGRVSSLCGVAPVSAAGSNLAGERLAMFEKAAADDAARQRIVDFSTGGRLSPTWCAAVAKRAGSAHLPQAIQAYLLQWGQGDFAQQAQTIKLPTLVMVGQFDPTINTASIASTWQVHHPHASVQEVSGAGHYPMLEAPAFVGSTLGKWLSDEQH
jgi:esterase